MLLQLDIHNMALIDNVSLTLEDGLNVLSGETGAGKSVIVESLHAIRGERLSREIIRSGCETAIIEAIFKIENEDISKKLDELGIKSEPDGSVIISREYSLNGKNVSRINGKLVTLSALNEIGEKLVDIHGQHDSQSLLKTENHAVFLDAFGGQSITDLKNIYSEKLNSYKILKEKINNLKADASERERRMDMLRFQIDEISNANLKDNEDEELQIKKAHIANAAKIKDAFGTSYELIYEGGTDDASARDKIKASLDFIMGVAQIDDNLKKIADDLSDIYYSLEDAASQIREERDRVDVDGQTLDMVEERLDLLFKLKRKYGETIPQILEYLRQIENEFEELEKSDVFLADYTKDLNNATDELNKIASMLHDERMTAAEELEARISEELEDLEMKKAKFSVNIDYIRDEKGPKFLSNGADRIEFLISPNVGEPLKPLSKIASGGEMSRIMLAIKKILADVDDIPTLLFDEIDIGISGRTAQKVGEKMSFISNSHQVICVTHLAQIACLADVNYLIEKSTDGLSTQTSVTRIENISLQKEIARILAGNNISDITMEHAKEMLDNAKLIKEQKM